jgi:hypothetical protein
MPQRSLSWTVVELGFWLLYLSVVFASLYQLIRMTLTHRSIMSNRKARLYMGMIAFTMSRSAEIAVDYFTSDDYVRTVH